MPADDDDGTLFAGPTRRLAQYVLLRQVGSGATGMVHFARDLDLDRPVAIKLLHGGGEDPKLAERFLREARSAAQLTHPNVALVYQVGRDGALTFIVMEWLAGGDLAQAVQTRGALPWREATAAVRDAAAGLAAAHAAGLVHRDIKPSNLMRTAAGDVKLVDFGLARLHDAPSDLTQAGSILGTPAYLSPEQCNGEAASPASDLYALGCTWYHLLTGQAPFVAAHMAAVLFGHMSKPMPDPRALVHELPEALVRVLHRACAKEPAQRHAGAAALRDELQALLDAPAGGASAGAAAASAAPASDAPACAATLPAPASAIGNLALDATSFIGRAAETAQLSELLQRSRLVTLTGPGGTGKTRLSLHVARLMAERFADGAWLVELAPLAAGAAHVVAGAAAEVLGLRDEAGHAIDERLIDHLRPRALLLVLDNCEHVIDAAAALARRITERCPQVRVLATSRQPLGVPGEAVLGVPPLGTGAEQATPAEQAASDAVRLFVERAAAARPGFALNADNAAAVAQVCRRLDGIPLAIELAAARVKVLAPRQIAARLDDAFKLLTGGQRTLLPRQQTLRALIDWSWDLLDEAERRLFARLGVFAGDFSIEAAESVLADAGADPIEVLDGLAGLVDKSLVITLERSGRMRYRTLETIRQYAAEKLAAAGETAALQQRHAAFYRDLYAATLPELHGQRHDEAAVTLQLEVDNTRAALDAATAGRWFDIAVPLAHSLADYGFFHGTLADSVGRLERLVALEPPPSTALAAMLQRAGTLASYLGRHELAQAWFEHGLKIACDAGDEALEGRLYTGLGTVAIARGDLAAAPPCFERALVLCTRLGDRVGEAKARNNLGIVLGEMGQVETARAHLHAALELHRATSRPIDLANGLMSLAELEQAHGAAGTAQPLFESSLNIFASLGDDWSAAYARDGLGKCAFHSGDLAAARRHFEQALEVLRRLGDKGAMADQLDFLAQIALREGDAARAAAPAAESLALRLELNNAAALAASFETQALLHAPAEPERSARCFGAMQALQQSVAAAVPPAREMRQRTLAATLRERLGDAAFERLRDEGMHYEPAVLARGV